MYKTFDRVLQASKLAILRKDALGVIATFEKYEETLEILLEIHCNLELFTSFFYEFNLLCHCSYFCT